MKRTSRIFLAGLVLAFASAAVLAQVTDEQREQMRKAQEFMRLGQQVVELLKAGKHQEAIDTCTRMAELLPDQPNPYYNRACAYALWGKPEEAFKDLALAVEKGFSDPAHLKADPDLESLHKDDRFAALVEKCRENEKKMTGGVYDKGAEIEGVKTVEDFPEGGLRYRLRMSPEATKEKPNRVIVWLHPSGGSMNSVVEALAPRFLKKNFALVVLTQKDWRGWGGPDADRLLKGTLPALARVDGISAEKPILLGYSAGGQVALQLWALDPGKYGGLVMSAAYPIRIIPGQGVDAMPLPEDAEAVKEVPVFVLVGEKDGGSRVWRQVEPEWRDSGVPLTIEYVRDAGHGWLFGNFQLAALDAWLADVAAGKVPRQPAPDKPEPLDPNEKPEPPEFR